MNKSLHEAIAAGHAIWTLDPSHSHVEFAVKHMMIATVKGRFADVEASLTTAGEDLEDASVVVEIDASSIDTRDSKRDQHLRSADFFGAETHPKLTFRSKRIERSGEDRYRMTGDLTIRDVTRDVVLDVVEEGRGVDPWGGERLGFTAQGRIDRTDFGLEWNQALETGGVLVGQDVRLTIDAEFVKQG